MMLALVILFQFLEKYMPFGDFGFVKFNLSLAFILVAVAHVGYIWGGSLLILRFVFGPLLSGEGYAPMSVIGQVILLIAGLIAISLFWVFKSRNGKYTTWQKLYKTFIVIGLTSVIMAILNAVVFTPWYLGAFNGGSWTSVGLKEAINQYQYITPFYFGIPNYWAGMLTVYTVFNIINMLMIVVITFPLLKVSRILGNKN